MKVFLQKTKATVETACKTINGHSLVVICYALVVFVISGCSSTTAFRAYPSKINPTITNLQGKQQIDLDKLVAEERTSNDLILYNMEYGRVAQMVGMPDKSISAFNVAIDKIRVNDEKAIISASDIGAQMAAVSVNDNVIPYQGESYERVMLHHYQALNFLIKNKLEGAGVESRQAGAEQNDALKRFEDELEKVHKDAEAKNVNTDNSTVLTQYAQMDEIAGRVKNSFQNAYTFFLSGLIYELLKQPNDAYIDYKKALEIFPQNKYLQKDVLRLANSLGMREDVQSLSARFKLSTSASKQKAKAQGELIVLFEDGFVPQKKEVRIPLFIPKIGRIDMAFPIYKEKWSVPVALSVSDDDAHIGSTETICDFRALAVKSLQEKAPAMATRQALRAVAKATTKKQATDKLGLIGAIVADVYNVVSENADLRSWLTLPENAQIMRAFLPSGKHKLTLALQNNGASTDVDVEIPPSGKTILYVIRAGGQFYKMVIPIE
ncbi:MAG: hypothetical protein WCJ49_01985 [Deltaproteobacteria bacterium]